MFLVRNMGELLSIYRRLGAVEYSIPKGKRFIFSDETILYGTVDLYEGMRGFFAAEVDLTYSQEMIFRGQLEERYIGIGVLDEGEAKSYKVKSESRVLADPVNCYVDRENTPFFLRMKRGTHIKFIGLYFFESFFLYNAISLYDSFWADAEDVLHTSDAGFPELGMIAKHIRSSSLSGEPFRLWLLGQGFSVAALLLDRIRKHAVYSPDRLHTEEKRAICHAKQILRKEIAYPPKLDDLARRVGINRNKMQKGFRCTEGRSVGEYVTHLRMQRALELLEISDLSIEEISKQLGYRCKANFYAMFKKTFGDTPKRLRNMLVEGTDPCRYT